VLLTVRTHGPYYTNSGYLPCARAHGQFCYTMVNYRETDQWPAWWVDFIACARTGVGAHSDASI